MKQKLFIITLSFLTFFVLIQQSSSEGIQQRQRIKRLPQQVKTRICRYLKCRGGRTSATFQDGHLRLALKWEKASDYTNVKDGECAWECRVLEGNEQSYAVLYTEQPFYILLLYDVKNPQYNQISFRKLDPRWEKIHNAIKNNLEYKLVVTKTRFGDFIVNDNQPYL